MTIGTSVEKRAAPAGLGVVSRRSGGGGESSVAIGLTTVSFTDAKQQLTDYATKHEQTLRWYDYAGHPERGVQASDEITLEDLGRLALINADLTGSDAAKLLGEIANNVDWRLVAHDERFEEAEYDSQLYKRMDKLWTQIRRKNIADAKISKLLHMKRPDAFPILDQQVRKVYRERARVVGGEYPKPGRQRVQRLYWEAIRRDIVASGDVLDELRRAFEGEPEPAGMLAGLGNLRIFDILAWRPA